jgi:hypothetical protein
VRSSANAGTWALIATGDFLGLVTATQSCLQGKAEKFPPSERGKSLMLFTIGRDARRSP